MPLKRAVITTTFYTFMTAKVHLHNGENYVKLLSFKEQKKDFAILKPNNLANFCHCVNMLYKSLKTINLY